MVGVQCVDYDQVNVVNVGLVLEGVCVLCIGWNGCELIGKGFVGCVMVVVVVKYWQYVDVSCIEWCQYCVQVCIFFGCVGVDQIVGQDDGVWVFWLCQDMCYVVC